MPQVLRPGDTVVIAGIRWEVKRVSLVGVTLKRGASYVCMKTWEELAAR